MLIKVGHYPVLQ